MSMCHKHTPVAHPTAKARAFIGRQAMSPCCAPFCKACCKTAVGSMSGVGGSFL